MRNMAISNLACRVAARFLNAEEQQQQAPQGQEASLPKSGPGMQMVKRQMDALNKAFEGGDAEGFGAALEELHSSHSKLAH